MLCKRYSHSIRLIAIISLSWLATACGTGDGPTAVTAPEPAPYVLLWADEFNEGTAPNVNKWRIETGYGENNAGWGNDEWQLYTDSSNNVRVANGHLIISAHCSTAPNCTDGASSARNGTITSARINTKDKFEFKYGKIQARIKPPPGKGTWPAFWMLGSNFPEQSWPGAGEIDIMEMHQFYSDAKTTHFTMHWFDEGIDVPGWVFKSEYKTFDNVLTDDFHVFEAEWDENRVIGKIDGITYFSKPIDPETNSEFLNSFFMILNVAVGGTLGGPPAASTSWPQQMLVDWVRVYKREEPATLELIPENTGSGALPFERIVNSVEFGGDSVVANLNSTAVTPLVGNSVLELDYRSVNAFYSGAAFSFNRADLSDYTKLVFSIDISAFPWFDDITIEMLDSRNTGGALGKVSLPLSNYARTETANWFTYEIPLSDFNGVNLDNVSLFGFWNPVDSSDVRIAGKLYLDNILFVTEPCTANGSVNFNADSYADNAGSAIVAVVDSCLANKTVVVNVGNGTQNIGVGITLDASGSGTATVNFGTTNDATSTIMIADGDTLTGTYVDTLSSSQVDTAAISSSSSGTPSTLAVYSDTKTSPVLSYVQIIDAGVDFGGNSTATSLTSSAVTPLEGSNVLEAVFVDQGQGYGGFIFNFGLAVYPPNPTTGQNISSYATLNFAIDASAMAGYADLVVQLEDGTVSPGVFLSSYTPSVSGNWSLYEIPLSDFSGIDLTNITYLGFWNASSSVGSVTITAGTLYFDDIYFAVANVTPPPPSSAGVYSETYTSTQIVYSQIIDAGVDFGGNSTVSDPASTAVTPYDGSQVLAVTYADNGAGYGGAIFNFGAGIPPASGQDISAYNTLRFALDTSAMASFADLVVQLEDGSVSPSVFLSNYTPTISANWAVYEIPLSDFAGLDLTNVIYLGFWNASSTVGSVTITTGTLYFDDVHFTTLSAPPPPLVTTVGVYSETHTSPVLSYVQIIDAGVDYGGNSTPTDENSTAVTPYDGSEVLAVSYADNGAGYGGAIFNFGSAVFPPNPTVGQDISDFGMLKFALDTSAMASFADLVVQLEDGSVAPAVFLSSYTPTISGNWSLYEIPLSDFTGLDLSNLTLLGFWNASSTVGSVSITTGTLYFDDIHFAAGGGISCTGCIDFEPGGIGDAGFTWEVFENDGDTLLEIVANPDAASNGGMNINTSSTVAKVTARVGGAFFAGAQTAHGDIGPLTLDSSNSTVKIMVWKSVTSNVGIQFVNALDQAQPPVLVTNTLTNQWEELTFDFSGAVGLEGNVNADRLVVFPDWNQAGRTSDNIIYFDNISFSPAP